MPAIAEAMAALSVESAAIDSEGVICRPDSSTVMLLCGKP
jgi:hypothetical protein